MYDKKKLLDALKLAGNVNVIKRSYKGNRRDEFIWVHEKHEGKTNSSNVFQAYKSPISNKWDVEYAPMKWHAGMSNTAFADYIMEWCRRHPSMSVMLWKLNIIKPHEYFAVVKYPSRKKTVSKKPSPKRVKK